MCERERKRERERVCVCVARERERVFVYVVSVCVRVCVFLNGQRSTAYQTVILPTMGINPRDSVCAYVCVW